ncbi:potassium transporter TrkH [Marinosulfonomonas sp. PRT-SC04]|nr:potassium transporter TrkH [Marinosulfonomonas sp. PRT-SC04]
MFDLRPVGFTIGQLVAALGVTMLIPMGVDIYYANGHWQVFLESAIITVLLGGMVALATANRSTKSISIQQTFLLTTGVWLALPVFGALPFIFGEPDARVVDAFFEAMSALTTTGSTVFTDLDQLPEGVLIWRSMMQWFGGIGIIVVAMVFLPELRIGGMQIFRSEGFDTMGKILPRAAQISTRISAIYLGLTVVCFLAYLAAGMDAFDAINHAFTTIATGGFSTHDASFAAFQGSAEYVAAVFMVLASLPFVRYVQLAAGASKPLLNDRQVRAFLWVLLVTIVMITLYRLGTDSGDFEPAFRKAVFNVTSIVTGTGYASVDYQLWGSFPVVLFFFMGLVGGCAGSTCCSVKIFRYQLLFASIRAQIAKIHSPHGIFTARYDGRPVSEGVISSVMAFFVMFIVTIGVLAVLLGATGLDFVTSVSGAATAIANIGPGLGDVIGPSGNFSALNDPAKWMLAAGMLIGRLELLVVFTILTAKFWKA